MSPRSSAAESWPSRWTAACRRHPRRLLLSGLLLLLVAAALWLWPGADRPVPPVRPAPVLTVSTVVARAGSVARLLPVTGTVVARDEIAIGTALQEQRIAAVLVEEGEQVTAGQLLARLETDTLDAQVQQAEAAMGRTRALIRQQEAQHVEAQASWRRIDPLGEAGAVSAQQIDQQRALALATAASLAAARAEHEQARAQWVDARARRDKAMILAPTDGVISERHARAGALGGDGVLFRLIRDGQLELDGEMPVSDLHLVRVGATLQVQVSGIARPVEGRVRLLAPKVEAASALGHIRIALAPEPGLSAGRFASATLGSGADMAAVVVPQRAVTFGEQDAASVMLVDDHGRARKRAITVGRRNGISVEVRSGLAAGERIVAVASAFVRDGDMLGLAAQGKPAP